MMARRSDVDAVVHEMRNELAVAKANLEGLRDGKLAATGERLASILQALEQLDVLIDDLARIRPQAEMSVRPTFINACQLLNREFNALEGVARAKDVRFAVHRCAVPTEACTNFYGDPVRIGQIVKNVLLNAVRYTPSGGSVSVECGREGDELAVTIADSGPGMSAKELNAIFAPGYRGVASEGTSGTGYGLSIVKRFVEEQGGSVIITASSSRGAAFTVKLPGTAPSETAVEARPPG